MPKNFNCVFLSRKKFSSSISFTGTVHKGGLWSQLPSFCLFCIVFPAKIGSFNQNDEYLSQVQKLFCSKLYICRGAPNFCWKSRFYSNHCWQVLGKFSGLCCESFIIAFTEFEHLQQKGLPGNFQEFLKCWLNADLCDLLNYFSGHEALNFLSIDSFVCAFPDIFISLNGFSIHFFNMYVLMLIVVVCDE